jgi:hypothetical protein
LKAKHADDSSTDDEDGGIGTNAASNNSNNVSKPHTKHSKSASASGSMMKYILMKPNDSSLAATIARLTASDGLSFRVFAKSTDMRRLFAAAGYTELPKSATSVQTLVSQHGQAVRSFVMTELADRLAKGQKFSLTFDEWTSTRNHRYMIVNVHEQGQKFWSLGLVRVSGSMPAEKCIELLEEKLAKFGLSLSQDIVAICTDGASVMCKVGRLIDAEHQLCLAHGIQLAVLDVLYKNKYNQRMDSDGDDAGDDGSAIDTDGERFVL